MSRNTSIIKAIGNELRNIRKVKNLSIKEVAEHTGVSESYMSEIERSKKLPSDDLVRRIAEAYSLDDLDLFIGFARITDEMRNEILHNKDLFTLLFRLSNENKLSNEGKQEFYSKMLQMYDKID